MDSKLGIVLVTWPILLALGAIWYYRMWDILVAFEVWDILVAMVIGGAISSLIVGLFLLLNKDL